jgi:hypothetical protein
MLRWLLQSYKSPKKIYKMDKQGRKTKREKTRKSSGQKIKSEKNNEKK